MFNLADKIKYYKRRFVLDDDNKRGYARGFVNGASVNHTKAHNTDDKKELSLSYRELKKAKSADDRRIILADICYLKGCLQGYNEKMKNDKK